MRLADTEREQQQHLRGPQPALRRSQKAPDSQHTLTDERALESVK